MDTERQKECPVIIIAADDPGWDTGAWLKRLPYRLPEQKRPKTADHLHHLPGQERPKTADHLPEQETLKTADHLPEWKYMKTTGRMLAQDYDRWIRTGTLCREQAVVVTDSHAAAAFCKKNRIACAGFLKKESGFFPDVTLVYEKNALPDMQELDRLRRRTYGLPVVVTQTDRLLLREMCGSDYRLWQEAWKGENCAAGPARQTWKAETHAAGLMDQESFDAYLHTAYPLYGYGYWAVQEINARSAGTGKETGAGNPDEDVREAPVIGFCGFRPYDPQEYMEESSETEIQTLWLTRRRYRAACGLDGMTAAPNEPDTADVVCKTDGPEGQILELGYVLLPQWRGRGLGTRMCLAAVSSAWKLPGVSSIVCRIRRDNRKSMALAARVGFSEYIEKTGN